MKVVAEEKLNASDLPRSILFMALGKGYALLVGMGDGQLAHWRVRSPPHRPPPYSAIIPFPPGVTPGRLRPGTTIHTAT